MTFKVLKKIEAETPQGALTLKHGQVIKLDKAEAIPLIESGMITPIEKVSYKVYSELLGCYLWIVDTDADLHSLRSSQGVSEAIYTAEEIIKLKGLDRDSLREIYKVKEVFENSKVEEITRKDNNHVSKDNIEPLIRLLNEGKKKLSKPVMSSGKPFKLPEDS